MNSLFLKNGSVFVPLLIVCRLNYIGFFQNFRGVGAALGDLLSNRFIFNQINRLKRAARFDLHHSQPRRFDGFQPHLTLNS